MGMNLCDNCGNVAPAVCYRLTNWDPEKQVTCEWKRVGCSFPCLVACWLRNETHFDAPFGALTLELVSAVFSLIADTLRALERSK